MEVSAAGGPSPDPRLQPAPQDELYVAGGGRLSISGRLRFPRHRGASCTPGQRRTRFSLSQQAGKACSPREQKAGGLEAPGACRKPELPVTSSARRGGGEPSKPSGGGLSEFLRKNPSGRSQRLLPLPRPSAFLLVASVPSCSALTCDLAEGLAPHPTPPHPSFPSPS